MNKRIILALLSLLLPVTAWTDCFVSGVSDQFTYFVAVDASDFTTRETGLSGFAVRRSRNGGASAAFTTPTINETDVTNMAGVYELLLDEDMTIDAGDDMQHMVLHFTVSGMAPVTKEICIERPKITAGNTLGVQSDGDLTKVNTLDAHTAQTGDNFARLGAPAGASVSADIVVLDNFVDNLESRIGTPSDFGSGTSTVAANLEDLADDGTAVYSRTTDSQQSLRDRGDAAWTTGGGTGLTALASGTAQSGTASTIVLASAETFADSEPVGNTICVHTGTGAGQCRHVSAYTGASDSATVEPDWTTNPSSDSQYEMILGSVNVSVWDGADITTALETSADIADAVLLELVADHSGTTGSLADILDDIVTDTVEIGVNGDGLTAITDQTDSLTFTVANQLDVNALSISGDATAANNLELQYDTTGLTGNTFPATQSRLDLINGTFLNCEVNTAFFAGSTTTFACILTDLDSSPVTQASNDLEGLQIVVTSGAEIREARFINDTTWDGANSELQLTISRALPATLADAVTVIIR